METVNWLEHSRAGEDQWHDFAAWLILKVVMEDKEKFKQLQAAGMKSDALQIEFKINGMDFPFVETCRQLENSLDNMILRKAKALIKEKFANLDDSLYDLHSMLKDAFNDAERKVREEFRVPFEDDRE